MIAPKKLTSKTYYRSLTNAREYYRILDKIVELDKAIFSHNTDSSDAINKLFYNDLDKENIAILFEHESRPIGYLFLKMITVNVNGKSTNVFQPLAGMLPEYIGTNIVKWVGLSAGIKALRMYGQNAFLAAFVINPEIYRSFNRLFNRIYPSPKHQDPQSIEAEVLNASAACWKIEPSSNLDNSSFFITDDVKIAASRSFNPTCEAGEFFVKHNASYQQGRYLGVCTKINLIDILFGLLVSYCSGYLKRFISKPQRGYRTNRV